MGKFMDKAYLSKEVGAFRFDFYYKERKLKRCYLKINDENGLVSLRIAGNTEAYGYLLTAAMQDREDQLHGYATLLTVTALSMTQEQEFAGDIEKAVNAHVERILAKGEDEAKKVTDAQEQGSQAFMSEIAEEVAPNP